MYYIRNFRCLWSLNNLPFFVVFVRFQTKISAAAAGTTAATGTTATTDTTAAAGTAGVFGPRGRTARRRPVPGGRVRRVRPQHPESADVQGGARGHAGPGQRGDGRGPGDQRRGRMDQAVRRVRGDALRCVVHNGLVAGRRHIARRLPEAGY